MAQGVRAAVAANEIEQDFLDLLASASRQVVRGRRPPSGGSRWESDEIDDLYMDMIQRVGMPKIVLAANEAASDGQFTEWIRTVLRTQLDQRARATPSGWVMERIDDALKEDPAFVRAADGWALATASSTDAWDGDRDALFEAGWSVRTRTIRQDPHAEKVQLAWRDDLRAVCGAILEAARGAVPKVLLGEIVAQRFSVGFDAPSRYLDVVDDGDSCDLVAGPEPLPDLEELATARWMLTQFTEEELVELRTVVLGGGSLRGIGEVNGVSKHKAALLKERVVTKLRMLGATVEDDKLTATAVLMRMVGQFDELEHLDQNDGDVHE